MPVARGRTVDRRGVLVVGASAVVVALVLVLGALWLSSRNDIQVRLGDDRFQDVDAESGAEEIAEDGPILFPDPANRGRDIYLQHLGEDDAQGWSAFDARPLGQRRSCFLQWDATTRELVDNGKCDGQFRFPEDGKGLPQYPATVNKDGNVVVDLNAADRDAHDTTTTTDTTANGEG